MNDLFHGYKVPIIYVYLKPFHPHDIKTVKQRLDLFNLTNNANWVIVQSINFTDSTVEEEFNFGTKKQEYLQKNMDLLLTKTKNFMLEGLFNSVASRTNEKIREEIEKLYNKKLNKNYLILERNISDIINELKMIESPTVINQNIVKLRENLEENIIK